MQSPGLFCLLASTLLLAESKVDVPEKRLTKPSLRIADQKNLTLFDDVAALYSDDHEELNQNPLTIEVLIVADYSTYAKWFQLSGNNYDKTIKELKFYFAHLINGVDEIYRGIQGSKYRFSVQLAGLRIATRPEDSPYTEEEKNAEGRLDATAAKNRLKQWVDANVKSQFDIVVGLIAFKGLKTTGSWWWDAMCNKKAIIVKDYGLESNIRYFAQTIAHSMGVRKDGDGNECSADKGNILGSDKGDLKEAWKFSSCSLLALDNFVSLQDEKDRNCLRSSSKPLYISLRGQKPGSRYDLDTQCRHIFGPSSHHCSNNVNSFDEICKKTSCHEEDKCSFYDFSPAYEGTRCGNGCWCVRGECVKDQRAPSNKRPCYGDHLGVIKLDKLQIKCWQIEEHHCSKPQIRELCCKKCASFGNN